jgi:DDE family transposase
MTTPLVGKRQTRGPRSLEPLASGGRRGISLALPAPLPSPRPFSCSATGTVKRVEMLFAHLKRILRLGRLRLRGPRGAQFEFTLAAIAQNLRRLAKVIARPPPTAAACVA